MRIRFTIRDLLWLTAVVAILLAWRFNHPAPAVGRYQIIPRPGFLPLMFDTATGRVWEQVNTNKWSELNSPVSP